VRPGPAGRLGLEGCDDSMKLRLSSSGCETRPARGEPARAGSEPCAGPGNEDGEALARERVSRGVAASKTMTFRMPRVLFSLKATAVSPQIPSKRGRGEEKSYPAGCSTMARTKRTAQ